MTPTPERDKNRGNHHEKHIDITHACWIYSPIDEWMHNLQFYPVFKNTKFMDVIPSNLLPVSVASANPYSWFNQPAIPVSLQWSLSLSLMNMNMFIQDWHFLCFGASPPYFFHSRGSDSASSCGKSSGYRWYHHVDASLLMPFVGSTI